jgi:hypothetical protein
MTGKNKKHKEEESRYIHCDNVVFLMCSVGNQSLMYEEKV